MVSLALLGLYISVEVADGHCVRVKSPQWNVFLFQGAVCSLFTFVSAHGYYLRYAFHGNQKWLTWCYTFIHLKRK